MSANYCSVGGFVLFSLSGSLGILFILKFYHDMSQGIFFFFDSVYCSFDFVGDSLLFVLCY